MARNWVQGYYQMKNPDRYVGTKQPFFRSSWENTFMSFCDNHPSVINWASEPLKIPYVNPLTGKSTIYVPDFLMMYLHNSGTKIAELIEIKPLAQAMMAEGKKMKTHEQATVIKNHAKWAAAVKFCKNYGLTFRVITENDIYWMGGGRR